jgi:hypothetical protein
MSPNLELDQFRTKRNAPLFLLFQHPLRNDPQISAANRQVFQPIFTRSTSFRTLKLFTQSTSLSRRIS